MVPSSNTEAAPPRRPRLGARMGVRSTLMLLVAVIAAPFLVLAIVNAERNLRGEQSAAEERALTRARLLAARVDDLVGSVDGLLLVLASTLSTDPADAPANARRLASIGAGLPPVYSQIRISTPDGSAIGHSTGATPNVGARKYFRDALARPGLAIGEPARSYRNALWTVGFARSVRDAGGQVRAVVSITLRLERMHEILDSRGLPAGSVIFLLSDQGIVLARSVDQEHWIGRDVSTYPTARRIQGNKEGVETITTAAEVERFTGYAAARTVPWFAVVASPTDAAFAAIRAEERFMLALFAGALGFALVAGWLAARGLVQPIRRITADALAFGGGDMTRRSQVDAPAEMGVLARTFNRLAADVAARTASLAASEARYRAMFESNPQPMWVLDQETLRFLAVNDAALAQYGYSREEFLAMPSSLLRPPEEEQRFLAHLARRAPGVGREASWRHRRKDGSLLDVEISTHDLLFDGRPALHSLVVDVTERTRMEREIRQLNLELEERVRARTAQLQSTNRELESFTYSVSHDLRSAAARHRRLCQAAARPHRGYPGRRGRRLPGADPRRGAAHGQLIDRPAAIVARLARCLDLDAVDLSAMARQICRRIAGRARPSAASTWRIEPGLAAHGDAGLLRSVLENLLGNALKYHAQEMPAAAIEFGGRRRAAAGREFYVRDNGAGFDMAYASKLFGAFQRLHSPAQFQGTGIGLATVQRIIERHGGAVSGEGRLGAGACFRFSLPERGAAP